MFDQCQSSKVHFISNVVSNEYNIGIQSTFYNLYGNVVIFSKTNLPLKQFQFKFLTSFKLSKLAAFEIYFGKTNKSARVLTHSIVMEQEFYSFYTTKVTIKNFAYKGGAGCLIYRRLIMHEISRSTKYSQSTVQFFLGRRPKNLSSIWKKQSTIFNRRFE